LQHGCRDLHETVEVPPGESVGHLAVVQQGVHGRHQHPQVIGFRALERLAGIDHALLADRADLLNVSAVVETDDRQSGRAKHSTMPRTNFVLIRLALAGPLDMLPPPARGRVLDGYTIGGSIPALP